jgi:hypothetical protein
VHNVGTQVSYIFSFSLSFTRLRFKVPDVMHTVQWYRHHLDSVCVLICHEIHQERKACLFGSLARIRMAEF